MTKINAQHFRDWLSEDDLKFERRIDEWLQTEAWTAFRFSLGCAVPKWIDAQQLENCLKERGFEVRTHPSPRGSLIYISLPSLEE